MTLSRPSAGDCGAGESQGKASIGNRRLQVEVMDGTEDNYEDLVTLLGDSGLEVTREP